MNLPEYSGPVRRSPKRMSPNPSCTHCLRIPPSLCSRSISSTFAPFLCADIAAAKDLPGRRRGLLHHIWKPVIVGALLFKQQAAVAAAL